MIESMRLIDFKNFKDATLSLGPLTVIVGTNASGKSNRRDAFRFVHGMSRGYSLAEIIGEKYVEGGVLQWKGIRGGTREAAYHGANEFTLVTRLTRYPNSELFDLDGIDRLPEEHGIRVSVGDAQRGPRVESEFLSNSSGTIYETHLNDDSSSQERTKELVVCLPRENPDRQQGECLRFVASQPVISQLPRRPEAGPLNKTIADCFLGDLRSMRFLNLAPGAMRVPSIPGQIVLGDRGENLSSVLQAICADESLKRAMTEWVRQLTPLDVVDFEFVPDQTGRILVNLVESSGHRVSAYSASDGTLRFLALIAALLGPDVAKFYFLEEIDNGIHPTRLYLLLQLIEQHAKEGKVQIVTTTHSPQLLAMLSPEAREHASLVYRAQHAPEGRIARIMDIPEARRVIEEQDLARLHATGWLEDAVAFSEPEAVAP